MERLPSHLKPNNPVGFGSLPTTELPTSMPLVASQRMVSEAFTRHLEKMIEQVLNRKRHQKPHYQTLNLTSTQQSRLLQLLGLATTSPFTIQVMVKHGKNALHTGAVVSVSGGMTGIEISRYTLTAQDVQQLTTTS